MKQTETLKLIYSYNIKKEKLTEQAVDRMLISLIPFGVAFILFEYIRDMVNVATTNGTLLPAITLFIYLAMLTLFISGIILFYVGIREMNDIESDTLNSLSKDLK